ncbi:MAG: DUF389 domain-containing protein [Nocardioides sp.]
MLVHLRLTVPHDLAAQVRAALVDRECATNLVVHEGASVDPEGDLIECDVAREKASEVLDELSDLGLDERGGIVVISPSSTPFTRARELEADAPGDPDDAVIWDAVQDVAEAASRPTLSFHIFLVLAIILAAIAVITDSAVLVVGAMVVGPEFGAIAAVCAGLVFLRGDLVLAGLKLLLFAFVFAIAVVTALALVAHATGLITDEMVSRPRPQTGFIWHPDRWSFLVALVAGTAGVLALSTEKTATMVGVLISVTTVPAAGNLALGLATWETGEILGSLAQLGANVGGMILAGTVFLAVQRRTWGWLTVHSERWFGQSPVK